MDAKQVIEDMDKSGIATAMISTSEPSVWFGDNDAARKLARECNDFGARLMSDHPGRFAFLTLRYQTSMAASAKSNTARTR